MKKKQRAPRINPKKRSINEVTRMVLSLGSNQAWTCLNLRKVSENYLGFSEVLKELNNGPELLANP
jgi:hypothetical protein